nr:putative disease resistance protein [Quercus suber]
MAEAVVLGVMTGIGDLLIQEGKFSSGVSNQIELLKTELNLMQGLLKNVDLRQDEPEPVRQWAAEIRELVYDADDIINNFKASSERGGLIQKILKSSRRNDIILYVVGFADFVTNANKPNIEKLGKEMVEYCGGLPLAITVLGGALAAKQTQDEWEDVLKHIKSYIFKEDLVNKVLCLSYNDLPYHLKPCFLYLGHFSEDFEILTEELIQMWMGEGFILQISHEEDSADTMEYKGEQYLRELM